MQKTILLAALALAPGAAAVGPHPVDVPRCEYRAVAAWVDPAMDDLRTRVAFLARNRSGQWQQVEEPEPRVLVASGGRKGQDLVARVCTLESLQRLVGDPQCAIVLSRVLSRSFGWAVLGEQGHLLPGLWVPLFDADGRAAELYTLQGDDLLIRFEGFMRPKYELFALTDSRTTMTPLAGQDPTRLEGSLRELATQIAEKRLAKITSVWAVSTEEGELRITLQDRSKRLLSLPQRSEPAPPMAKLAWKHHQERQLLFLPGKGIHVLELDGWPPQVRRDGDLARLNLPLGKRRLVARVDVTYTGVARTGEYGPQEMRHWTPPLTLEFEVIPGCSYELVKVREGDELGLAVFERSENRTETKIAAALVPWVGIASLQPEALRSLD